MHLTTACPNPYRYEGLDRAAYAFVDNPRETHGTGRGECPLTPEALVKTDAYWRARQARLSGMHENPVHLERQKISENPGQYDNLGIVIREQRAFEAVVRDSLLPTLSLDVTSKTVDAVVTEIAEYRYDTGRIYPTY